jgi:SAM-dependent methyltransferase
MYRRSRAAVASFKEPARSFDDLPVDASVRIAYNVVLRRDPDDAGRADFEHRLAHGLVSREHMVEEMRGSEEFILDVRFTLLGYSIHGGRCGFIQSLPPARRILDLGGTHKTSEHGAMVRMGYPYAFEELVVVDLPADDRHPIYQGDVMSERAVSAPAIDSPLGPVTYRYHSMTDLSGFDDASFDLVYMGQSIEHVTEEDGDHVLKEIHRILAPGGRLALDTPNARVTRLQQAEFIDPDHKFEYTFEELSAKLEKFGFTILEAKGLNYAGRVGEGGEAFSLETVAANSGLFADARNCYLLAFVCAR